MIQALRCLSPGVFQDALKEGMRSSQTLQTTNEHKEFGSSSQLGLSKASTFDLTNTRKKQTTKPHTQSTAKKIPKHQTKSPLPLCLLFQKKAPKQNPLRSLLRCFARRRVVRSRQRRSRRTWRPKRRRLRRKQPRLEERLVGRKGSFFFWETFGKSLENSRLQTEVGRMD